MHRARPSTLARGLAMNFSYRLSRAYTAAKQNMRTNGLVYIQHADTVSVTEAGKQKLLACIVYSLVPRLHPPAPSDHE